VYQIGLSSKLEYIAGNRRPKEYAQLWSGLISPLLECGDWFMKPYSFILSAEFLFFDRNRKTVHYVYVPTIRDSSDYGDLKEMAAEVSKLISVADSNMENRVLRAIMKDFDPQGFLQMLKDYAWEGLPAPVRCTAPTGSTAPGPAHQKNPQAPVERTGFGEAQPVKPVAYAGSGAHAGSTTHAGPGAHAGSAAHAGPEATAASPASPPSVLVWREARGMQAPDPGEIIIEIPASGPLRKKSKESQKGVKKQSAEKGAEHKNPGGLGGLFGKKKDAKPGVPAPAPGGPAAPAPGGFIAPTPGGFAAPAPGGFIAPAPGGFIAPVPMARSSACPPAPAEQYAPAAPPAMQLPSPAYRAAEKPPADANDDTQTILVPESRARFHYIGRGQFPPSIDVRIGAGQIFTIGRYDGAAGRQQSSFEFDKKTKAVSRRHAVVERGPEGYSIIDLASSAGTFLNGKKIPPNTPCKLEQGCRVSFGNSGADYVWDE